MEERPGMMSEAKSIQKRLAGYLGLLAPRCLIERLGVVGKAIRYKFMKKDSRESAKKVNI